MTEAVIFRLFAHEVLGHESDGTGAAFRSVFILATVHHAAAQHDINRLGYHAGLTEIGAMGVA